MTKKTIILDRDGVINKDSSSYIKTVEEFVPLEGSLEAIAALTQAGWQVCIATNQSGLARALFTEQTLLAMHHKLKALLEPLGGSIDYIAYCPHLPDDACPCRKPGIGLLLDIQKYTQCDFSKTPFVGDSLKDIQAALKAGCLPKLVQTGNGLLTEQKLLEMDLSIPTYTNLMDVVEHILL